MRCSVARRKLCAGGLFAAGMILLLLQPTPASAGGYTFMCRGQILVDTSLSSLSENVNSGVVTATYQMTVHFKVNPTGAGAAGQNLQAGACAWVDRATNSNEGTTLAFTFIYSATPPNTQMLAQCSTTRNCVFAVTATNPSGSALIGNTSAITTLFPANLGYTIIPDPTSP
jgi:hypothetical protein